MDEVERLLELGRMDLEAGYPQYAREYFEKVLALDATNREAIDALARIDELRRRAAAPVKPIQAEPVKPPPKVEQKRSIAEKKRQGQVRSPMRWFKRQSRLNKIAVLISIPLLSCLLCLALSEFISPSPEAIPTPIPARHEVEASPTPGLVEAIPTPIPPSPVPLPTATPRPKPPTSTPIPTKTPAPKYKAPVVLLELDGTGKVVSNNYRLPRCWKAVLYWSVEANNYGSASLIVHLHNVQDATQQTMVNEFAMDVRNISESVFVPLKGGEYYLSTENTDEAWSLRMECQDGVAPSGIGLDLQGAGNMVTGNYELHQCQKSIFAWSTEPDSYGTASLIMYLCGADDRVKLVNEFGMDLSEALTGEALQALSGGNYFLVVENTSGRPWGVRWECKD